MGRAITGSYIGTYIGSYRALHGALFWAPFGPYFCAYLKIQGCPIFHCGRAALFIQNHLGPRTARLGLKQRSFPVTRIDQIARGCGKVPLIDVVVLRTLPTVYLSWSRDEKSGSKFPDERSYSQEISYKEKLVQDDSMETRGSLFCHIF